MKAWSWRSAGAAFLLNGVCAVPIAVAEQLLSGRGHVGMPAGVGDYLYGIQAHLLIALVAAFATRIVDWKASQTSYPVISLSVFLMLEFGVVGAYWAGTADVVPRFHTREGKLVTAALLAAGAFVGLLVAYLIGRVFPRERWQQSARRGLGAAGLLLAVVLIVVTGLRLWNAWPRPGKHAARPDADALERESVIVLLVDTLRRDHLSYFGHPRPTSPRIDALLRESCVFRNAYTPSTWTIPSVASLFTGFYPTSHGVTSALDGIPEEAPTLAEHFRSYGYRTAAFVGNPILTGRNGFAQGFGHYFPPDPPWWSYHNRTAIERIATQLRRPGTQGLAWKLVEEALEWVRRDPEAPLFLYVHFMEPHSPYAPPPRDREAVAPATPPGPVEPPRLHDHLSEIENPECHDWECLDDPPQLPASELLGMVANYDGEIHSLDAGIGKLLRGIEELGLLDRSHLVFCTDHGEEFFDHRGWYHGNSIYEEMTGCPLAYRPPGGLAGGRTIGRPVGLLDIVPTLCERLGIETPPLHQGRIIPELFGRAPLAQPTPVLSEWPRHLFSLRLGPWKLIRRGSAESPEWRLFQIEQDPREARDLAAQFPDTLAYLRGYLEGLLAEYRQCSLGSVSRTTDPELLQRLRSLGYIQ
ncbi:MAG: sulfatase-like hydrolase/transferase [Candidatus Eisenbacteria bacterium]|nr:sulfatase-like hydrolase/transferase [Candidatus Eisenbacteria bacterium]